MNKTKVLLFVFGIALFIGIIGVYFFYIYGWYTFRKNTDTSSAYESHVVAPRRLYLADKDRLGVEMGQLLARKEDFFDNSAYGSGTKIIIDTILYSPDFNRLAILLIAKNPTNHELMPDREGDWYYDGTSYLGSRSADSIILWQIGSTLLDGKDQNSISDDLRRDAFRLFISDDTTARYHYRFNMNDVRFWHADLWDTVAVDIRKRKEFKLFELQHPEDVYDPKLSPKH